MYDYKTERENVFSEEGLTSFLKIRKNVINGLELAGAVRIEEVVSGVCGDSWTMLACFDLMVERDELREVTGGNTAGQHRVFVRGKVDFE